MLQVFITPRPTPQKKIGEEMSPLKGVGRNNKMALLPGGFQTVIRPVSKCHLCRITASGDKLAMPQDERMDVPSTGIPQGSLLSPDEGEIHTLLIYSVYTFLKIGPLGQFLIFFTVILIEIIQVIGVVCYGDEMEPHGRGWRTDQFCIHPVFHIIRTQRRVPVDVPGKPPREKGTGFFSKPGHPEFMSDLPIIMVSDDLFPAADKISYFHGYRDFTRKSGRTGRFKEELFQRLVDKHLSLEKRLFMFCPGEKEFQRHFHNKNRVKVSIFDRDDHRKVPCPGFYPPGKITEDLRLLLPEKIRKLSALMMNFSISDHRNKHITVLSSGG
jgi:hypothetical protein